MQASRKLVNVHSVHCVPHAREHLHKASPASHSVSVCEHSDVICTIHGAHSCHFHTPLLHCRQEPAATLEEVSRQHKEASAHAESQDGSARPQQHKPAAQLVEPHSGLQDAPVQPPQPPASAPQANTPPEFTGSSHDRPSCGPSGVVSLV